MSQNSEQQARYAGKCDFCDYGGVFAPACAALSRATGFAKRCTEVALIRRLRRNQGSARVEPPPGGSHPLRAADAKKPAH